MEHVMLCPARPDESPLVCDLILRAFEEYRATLTPQSSAHRETPESIGGKMVKGGALIVEVDSVPAATTLYMHEPDFMYLGRLAVLPEYRGKGLARLLVNGVEDIARARGLGRVRLGARLALSGNIALFERLGYHITEYKNDDRSVEIYWVILEKQIAL